MSEINNIVDDRKNNVADDTSANNVNTNITNSNNIELTYGNIDSKDIPLVMSEPYSNSVGRKNSWLSIIIVVLLILSIFIFKEYLNKKDIRYQTHKMLITEKKSLLNRCDLLANKIQPPNAKYIEINIPKESFPNITIQQLNCLFSYQITSYDGKFLQLKGSWIDMGTIYKCILILPNYMNLSSFVLHTLMQQLFAKGWNNTFKSFNLLIKDKGHKIIWKDTIILDINTGDSSVGNIGDGYIPIQFDLEKYY